MGMADREKMRNMRNIFMWFFEFDLLDFLWMRLARNIKLKNKNPIKKWAIVAIPNIMANRDHFSFRIKYIPHSTNMKDSPEGRNTLLNMPFPPSENGAPKITRKTFSNAIFSFLKKCFDIKYVADPMEKQSVKNNKK